MIRFNKRKKEVIKVIETKNLTVIMRSHIRESATLLIDRSIILYTELLAYDGAISSSHRASISNRLGVWA